MRHRGGGFGPFPYFFFAIKGNHMNKKITNEKITVEAAGVKFSDGFIDGQPVGPIRERLSLYDRYAARFGWGGKPEDEKAPEQQPAGYRFKHRIGDVYLNQNNYTYYTIADLDPDCGGCESPYYRVMECTPTGEPTARGKLYPVWQDARHLDEARSGTFVFYPDAVPDKAARKAPHIPALKVGETFWRTGPAGKIGSWMITGVSRNRYIFRRMTNADNKVVRGRARLVGSESIADFDSGIGSCYLPGFSGIRAALLAAAGAGKKHFAVPKSPRKTRKTGAASGPFIPSSRPR